MVTDSLSNSADRAEPGATRTGHSDAPLTHAGKILTRSLEVNLTDHCNLSCYGCDHASPLNPEGYLSPEELARDLAALAKAYHVFEFMLTGGEPLLHPRLLEVIDTIRASGVAEKIRLVTNGVLLHKAPEGLWTRIDKIWVSVYPGVKRKLSHEEIRALADRAGVFVYYKATDEFTAKLLHSENRDPELVRAIYSTCTLRTSCHTIHKGRYYKCSPSPFIPDWLRRVGIAPPDFSGDSVPVRNNPDLGKQLAAFLASPEPLTACRYCLGCIGKSMPSRQMNKAAAQQWVAERDPDVGELIDRAALARAQVRLQGVDLSGMLHTMVGEKVRWWFAAWLKRILGIDRTGVPARQIGLRIRAALTRMTRWVPRPS